LLFVSKNATQENLQKVSVKLVKKLIRNDSKGVDAAGINELAYKPRLNQLCIE